jgi:hypothetical protein
MRRARLQKPGSGLQSAVGCPESSPGDVTIIPYSSFLRYLIMAVYLNTYETWEAYGGPEEGGWWYECGSPVQSLLISHDDYEEWMKNATDELLSMREKATYNYTQGQAPTPIKNGTGGYTFVLGSDTPSTYQRDNSFNSCFEEHFAEPYPKERPYYC